MRTMIAALTTLAIAVGVAACGSGSSTTSAAPSSNASASQSGSGSATGAYGPATARTRRLGTKAEKALNQMATAAGRLATGNSQSENQARALLAQAQTRSHQIAQTAQRKLAPTNPARTLIVQATDRAAKTAGTLRTMKINGQTQRTLQQAQTTLSNLAGEIGLIRAQPGQANVAKITGSLQSLAREVTGMAGSS